MKTQKQPSMKIIKTQKVKKKKAKVINFLQVLIPAADIIILTCKFNLPFTSQGVIFYDLNKNTLII